MPQEIVGVSPPAQIQPGAATQFCYRGLYYLSLRGEKYCVFLYRHTEGKVPYLQYAYTRIRSIFRRAEIDSTSLDSKIVLQHPVEFALAVKLLQFPEAIDSVTDDFQANVLCNYLFEVSGQFMSFYEACPILNQDDEIKNSRLMIADITSKILKQGLELLGIQTVEKM